MLLIIEQVIKIVFMLTFMFIGIWGFIIMMKMYNQLKYRNYILEKLSQNVYMITTRIHKVGSELHLSDSEISDELDDITTNISKFKK